MALWSHIRICCRWTATEGTGLDELLDKVLLQADVLELKANVERDATGAVLEARVEKGLGTVATTLVQRGTLRVGDVFVAGAAWGKVRALLDDEGARVDEAGPSSPVQVNSLARGPPPSGMKLQARARPRR